MIKKIFMLSLLSVAGLNAAHAEGDDWGVWTDLGVTKKLNKQLSISGDAELRSQDGIKNVDSWRGTLGVGYKFCPYFKMAVEYTYIYRYTPSASEFNEKGTKLKCSHPYWQSGNRFKIAATGMLPLGNLKFSLTEAFQTTRYNSADYTRDVTKVSSGSVTTEQKTKDAHTKNILRSKLGVDYKIAKSAFSPFAAVELYSNTDEGFAKDKLRYTLGTEYKINKQNKVELYYRYIDTADEEEAGNHIIGIGYNFSF